MRAWDKSKPSTILRVLEKEVRANVIARYVAEADYEGVVVFTCGNAACALRKAMTGWGTQRVVEVGPHGTLNTDTWWTPAEIRRTWPSLFDATSGHLPLTLMVQIAEQLRAATGPLDASKQYLVPTGSGETIVCLGMAYPDVSFCAVYDNNNLATTRDNEAPLNPVVDAEFPVQYWHGQLTL